MFPFLSANNNTQLFFYPNHYRVSGEIHSYFEGEIASATTVKKYKLNSAIGIEGISSEFQIPISTPENNKSVVNLDVYFEDNNPLNLKIKRTTTNTGELKKELQSNLVLYEDWDKTMRERLFIETNFWEDIENDKSSKRYIDNYRSYFEDKRKEQKELIQSEFKAFHNNNSGELISYNIKSIGSTVDKPAFEFETEYVMDGLVKKAGENYLIDLNKLIGIQWIPTKDERTTDYDIYMPTAMSIEKTLTIHIPSNYSVQAIENLNKMINNEYGSFSSSITIDGDKLKISTSKIYKQSFVPKNELNGKPYLI